MDIETRIERYVYEALSYETHHHPIRLLKVLQGEKGNRICCELFHTHLTTFEKPSEDPDSDSYCFGSAVFEDDDDFEGDPRYTALSYVWGDHTDTVAIQVCGKELSVTRNLFKFLECHRDTFLRNRSTEPLFWIDAICIDQSNIGERSRQVEFMAEVYKKAQNVLIWLGEENEDTSIAFEAAQKWNKDYQVTEQERQACSKTFEGGWWDRLWVVQEAVHARSLLMRCGTLELSWESFDKRRRISIGPFLYVRRMIACRRGFQNNRRSATWVLNVFGPRKCYDPRDVIFATRSIVPALVSVVPDYSLCIADVFISATRAIISHEKNLNVLRHTSRQTASRWGLLETRPTPSWVPNWTARGYGLLKFRTPLEFKDDDRIDDVLSHEDPSMLLLKGVPVDQIFWTTAPFRSISWEEQSAPKVDEIKQLQSWFPECDKKFVAHNTRPDLNLNNIVNNWLQRRGKTTPAFRTIKSLVERMDRVWRLGGYSFITTQNGRHGFVLGEAKEGDLVFVTYGLGYPLVLRQEDTDESSYRLIGCAIIDELMDGEAFEMVKAGTLDKQTILLR